MYFFHNAYALMQQGTGPYFYVAKIESHLEARLWNDVFVLAQKLVGIPTGTIRYSVVLSVEAVRAGTKMRNREGYVHILDAAIERVSIYGNFTLNGVNLVTRSKPVFRGIEDNVLRSERFSRSRNGSSFPSPVPCPHIANAI